MKHDCRISGHVKSPCGPYVTLKKGGLFSSPVYDLRANTIDGDNDTYVGNYYYLQECKCRYCGRSLGLQATDRAPESVVRRYAEYCAENGMEFIGMPGGSEMGRSQMYWLPEKKTPSFYIPKVTVRDEDTGRAINRARITADNIRDMTVPFVKYTNSNGVAELPEGFKGKLVRFEIEAPGHYSLCDDRMMSEDAVFYLTPIK